MSNSIPQISILMAVHNGQRYLVQAIESILEQTFTAFELIVVDDGSTDQTPDLLWTLSRRDSRIALFQNERNLGLAGSLNRGLAACRAPLVARADSDDVFKPNRLEKQVRFMKDHPNIGVIGSAVEFIDQNGNPMKDKLEHFPTTPEEVRFRMRLGCCFWHTTVVFRTDLIRSVGGYDVAFTRGPEDYDLWGRLLNKTEFANLPDALAMQRLHGESLTANWDVGFKMYCSVSRRLLSEYLERAVGEQEATDAVTLFGWNNSMPGPYVFRGIQLLREIRTHARKLETRGTRAGFELKCARGFFSQAEVMVYEDPCVARSLWQETLCWWPLATFSRRGLAFLMRMTLPRKFRQAVKAWRSSLAQ